MGKKILWLLTLLTLAASPALGAGKNKFQVLLDDVTVTDAAPRTVAVVNPNHSAAYLRVRTTGISGAPSLQVTVEIDDDLAGTDATICSPTAITANGVAWVLLGSTVAAAGDIATACDFPLPLKFNVVFTITGASTSFDVFSELHWVEQ